MALLNETGLQYTLIEDDYPPAAAVIVAGGDSTRMGENKQFIPLLCVPVIARTLLAFEQCPDIRDIVVSAREEDIPDIQQLCERYNISKLYALVKGGTTRQQSVEEGIRACAPDIVYFAIHDGARPLIECAHITLAVQTAISRGAAAVGVFVKDTIKRVNIENKIVETPRRESLIAIQTPQVFEAQLYKKALVNAKEKQLSVTDDCALAEAAGFDVFVVEGSYENIKITTPEDIAVAEAILLSRGQEK